MDSLARKAKFHYVVCWWVDLESAWKGGVLMSWILSHPSLWISSSWSVFDLIQVGVFIIPESEFAIGALISITYRQEHVSSACSLIL